MIATSVIALPSSCQLSGTCSVTTRIIGVSANSLLPNYARLCHAVLCYFALRLIAFDALIGGTQINHKSTGSGVPERPHIWLFEMTNVWLDKLGAVEFLFFLWGRPSWVNRLTFGGWEGLIWSSHGHPLKKETSVCASVQYGVRICKNIK